MLGGKSFLKLDKLIQEKINETIKDLESEALKAEAREGLNKFATRAFLQFVSDLGVNNVYLISAIKVLSGKSKIPQQELKAFQELDLPVLNAVENAEYTKEYMGKVKTALENLRQIEATGYGEHVSLRNVAEFTVRHERQQAELKSLIDSGEMLVVCSTHGNCSKRCEPWQGRYYTLGDETIKHDKKTFIPLSTATEIYVTTKSGKTYRNGLLGFNCRHKILPYRKGERIPDVSAKVVEKERAIDQKMRQLERNVRVWREVRDINQGINQERYLKAKDKAIEWNKKYIEFAKSNDRAYYPDRVKII